MDLSTPRLVRSLAWASLLAALAAPAGANAEPTRRDAAPEVIVRFSPAATATQRSRALWSVDADAQRPLQALARVREVTLPPDQSVEDALRTLRGRPGVEWAEANSTARAVVTPNDPRYPSLWGMPDIGAPTAWDTTTGSARIPVAIADTGIDAGHPDVGPNLQRDLSSNFVPTGSAVAWTDLNGHGTHVAGTIGGVGNNGIGVAGVNWSSALGAIRVLRQDGSGEFAWVADGMAWSGARARVVNLSLGGFGGDQVLDAAIAANPNTLYVAAAGNDAEDVDQVRFNPCAVPRDNVICVAAITSTGRLAKFSNFGATTVDLGAPGQDIDSAYVPYTTIRDDSSTDALQAWSQAPPASWSTAGRLSDGSTTIATDGLLDSNLPGEDAAVRTTLAVPRAPLLDGVGCRLDYYANYRLLATGQGFRVEARAPVRPWAWEEVDAGYGGDDTKGYYYPLSVDLSRFDGVAGVEVRFVVEGPAGIYGADASTKGFLAIALPKFTCIGSQTAAGEYLVADGTSMAAPHVAGAAALVLAKRPELTAVQVKQAILSTVTPTPDLFGKTVTGARLNVAAALASVTPPPTPAATPAPAPAPAPVPMAMSLRGRQPVALRALRSRVKVPVQCTGTAATQCISSIMLRRRVAATRTRPARWVGLGTALVTTPAGWRGTRTVELNGRARAMLATRQAVAVQVRMAPRSGRDGPVVSARARIVAP